MCLVALHQRKSLKTKDTEEVIFLIFNKVNAIYAHKTLLWPMFVRLFVPDPISFRVYRKLAKFTLRRHCAVIDSRV
jgi:hypothetical protein